VKGTTNSIAPVRLRAWGALLIGVLLWLIGVWLSAGGVWLLSLGGSAYYLLAGLGSLAAAVFYVTGRPAAGMLTYLVVFFGTCVWAIAEVRSDFWQLLPRVAGPALFAAIVLLHYLGRSAGRRRFAMSLGVTVAVAAALFLASLTRMTEAQGGRSSVAAPALRGDDWLAFGRTAGGDRYSPAAQITPANVGSLQVAWRLRTGDRPGVYRGERAAHTFETTPLKIGDILYLCTPHNVVFALDADTGRQVWRFDPKVNTKGAALLACRGVSYFEAAAAGDCARRIIFGTLDARLIALDALTGKPCPGFGRAGTVALRDGMGVAPDGYYSVTSPPTIANGIAVVGGFVFDGLETNEPSGVVRGYDATTGALTWSWDSGARDENWRPKSGEHYTRGSPNSWSVMSADPDLGLVYVPMGNATPDYVGMHRTLQHDRYSSAVVALDSRTGARRWHFQTVRHDLWDYDIGSQPVLFDLPTADGTRVPALAQPTKQGDIYILDRRTGRPLTKVVERPVSRGTIPTERYASTQPVSVGFPSPLSTDKLAEKDMWGVTPLDQLVCRIRFRAAGYTGRYTPPSIRPTIQYPSNFGVMDWGSVAIGDGGATMFVNSSHLPMIMQLIPRKQLERQGAPKHNIFSPQVGTPYAANPTQMLSPLGIPCNAPPWGKLTAIDLATRKIKWQRPLGTTRDQAPFGIAVPGAPNIAGAVATAGGLLFIGATTDNYLRAFSTATGEELWRARLPAGGQAAPITYVSDRTGRQYIVIAAGGHQLLGTTTGDHVIAYALPRVQR
jgi:quinoprotein glucose dehydrogenase